ncbi:glycerophosphodiester phosphodiesterase family protein [Flammeovirgaceae bacterium SG7u.111]|nr:glycerophosphodiester phosphodiesterase family protein [Flammeovirgaceae bacterium SG7u.132]WPO33240.1 glycerophosphodiester phosphodiesterase family protein [Flammeovirgaceae bacterium SG7u.111]
MKNLTLVTPFLSLLLFFATHQGYAQVERIKKEFFNPTSKQVLVAAHRAAHKLYPENSLEAIQHAIDLGFDIVEIDVRVSKDGVPVLMHDGTIDRTTDGTGKPEDLYLAELQDLFLLKDGEKTDYRIPTLEDALAVCEGKIMVDLDLKTSNIAPIIEVIQGGSFEEIVFFFDSDYRVLKKLKKADANFALMPRAHSEKEAGKALTLFEPAVVHIDASFYSKDVVELIKERNARVWINALGDVDKAIRETQDEKGLEALVVGGANIIQTDEPEFLLKFLKGKGLHW